MEKKGSETTGNKSNNDEKNEKKMDSTNIDLDDKDFKGKKKDERQYYFSVMFYSKPASNIY